MFNFNLKLLIYHRLARDHPNSTASWNISEETSPPLVFFHCVTVVHVLIFWQNLTDSENRFSAMVQ